MGASVTSAVAAAMGLLGEDLEHGVERQAEIAPVVIAILQAPGCHLASVAVSFSYKAQKMVPEFGKIFGCIIYIYIYIHMYIYICICIYIILYMYI